MFGALKHTVSKKVVIWALKKAEISRMFGVRGLAFKAPKHTGFSRMSGFLS